MTIKVYPFNSGADAEAVESHDWEGTILEWFDSNGWSYSLAEKPKSYITVNGFPLPVEQWSTRHLKNTDEVKITLLQNGGIFKGLGSILSGVLGFVFSFLMPSNKSGRDYNAPQQGKKLETVSAKANTAKKNDVVPELAGTFRRYVDYLNGPRRYFQNKREQLLEFHACIGPGYYEIDENTIKIADTPFNALRGDAWYQLFEPNADLSGVSTHENWYTSPEVGGTSSGTAGLELSTELANRENTDPASYLFDGLSITRETGRFPSGWGSGTKVTVLYPSSYAVTTVNMGSQFETINASALTGYIGHLPKGIPSSSGVFAGWSPLVTNGDADGIGTVVFYKDTTSGSGTVRSYLSGIPFGTRNYTLADLYERSLVSYSDDSISFDEYPFQDDTSVIGAKVTFSGGTVYGEWTSEFIVCPVGELTSTIEVDFFLPSGLCYFEDNGNLSSRSVGVEYQYRDVRGGASTTIRKTYTDRTLDQIGFTERHNIPLMRAAVRTRRIGAASTSTQVHDTIQWYGLKCRLPTVTRYENWSTMAVRLRSGGRLAAQSENQINLIATRKLNILLPDGSWSSDLRPTKDISAWARYVAHTIGYTDENLDMDELRRLHDLWTSRGETYSAITDLTTVKDAINTAFGAGMAALTVQDGQIRPVREGVRTQFEQSYSPQNMTKPLRRAFRGHTHSDNDGAEVEYYDSESWELVTVECIPDGSQGIKLEKVRLNFALTKTQAWRIGMRIAYEQKYGRWDYSWSTEMDALNSTYGGYVALIDDLVGYGQSAKMLGIYPDVGGALIVSSDKLNWVEGERHVIGYRKPDGKLAGPWEAIRQEDDYMVVADIPKPWPSLSLKMELPDLYFGPAEKFAFAALITDIKPSGTDSVSVKAKNYDVRIYADDDNFPE